MNEITTTNNATVTTVADERKVVVEQVKKYLSLAQDLKGVPEEVKEQFIELCIATHANPLAREAYLVGYNGKYTLLTGYNVYLKRAEQIGSLDGWKAEYNMERGECISVTVTIWRKDRAHEFQHTAFMSEWNKGIALWKSSAKFMLMKVAVCQAFRLCFPCEFNDMPYAKEEREDLFKKDDVPAKSANIPETMESLTNRLGALLKDSSIELKNEFNAKYHDLDLKNIKSNKERLEKVSNLIKELEERLAA